MEKQPNPRHESREIDLSPERGDQVEGAEPTPESFESKNREAEPGTSAYRIVKLKTLMGNLATQLKNYFELEAAPYSKSKFSDTEKTNNEIVSIFIQVERLLPRMEDFPLTDEEVENVLNLMDQIETLKKEWYAATSRYQEARDRSSKIEQFVANLEEKVKEIISNLDKLPADKRSSLKFEGGHYIKLLEALNREDIEVSRDIILEIDRLLTDDYTGVPKKLTGGATLRFRLEQALEEPNHPKASNYKRVELSKGVLVIRTSQEKVEVSLDGLDEDQQGIWEKIK